METKKVRIIRAIEQTPIVFGYPVDKAAILAVLLMFDFFILLKSLLLGGLFLIALFALVYFYLKGYIREEVFFYQKFRYLVFNKNVKQKYKSTQL